MAKDQQTKPTEKTPAPKPAAQPSGQEMEGAPPPVSTGKVFSLPRNMQRRQVRALQRVAGNRYVQRKLVTNIIQRDNGSGGGDTTPIPTLPDAEAKRSLALKVLKKAYGGFIKNEANIESAEGLSALQAQYDISMITQGKKFRENDELRDWKMGDAANHPNMSKDFAGFYDPRTGTVIIDTKKPPDEQVATIGHELLHANASGEIISTFGRRVDEGMTENFMKEAFAKSGYSAPGNFFQEEIKFVGLLNGYFGANMMKAAYFGSVAGIRTLVDTAFDEEGKFDKFASALRAANYKAVYKFFEQYEKVRRGSELEKKAATILSIMDEWFFDEGDLARIQTVWNNCTPEEKRELRSRIESEIGSLSSHADRAELRFILQS